MQPIKIPVALNNPWMVAAWHGIGRVALGAVEYLTKKQKAVPFAEIPPKNYFDITGVMIKNSIIQYPRFPKSLFYYCKGKKTARDMILFTSESQPSLNVYQYCKEIVSVAKNSNIKRIITFAAAPTSIHHSETPDVWGVATSAELLEELIGYNIRLMSEGQIRGLNGLLLGVAAEEGVDGVCLLGELPYYTVGIPNPKASKAVLERFMEMAGIKIDMEEMDILSKESEIEIEHLLETTREEHNPQENVVARHESQDLCVRHKIEKLFEECEKDKSKSKDLKEILDDHNLFKEYEDRFLDLFKRAEEEPG